MNSFLYGTPEAQASRLKAQQEASVPLAQFDTSYDVTFRSTLRALVDLGLMVHSSDVASGFISAALDQRQSPPFTYLPLWSINSSSTSIQTFHLGTEQEISVLVDKMSDQKTEVKITSTKAVHVEEVNGQIKFRPLEWDEGVSNKMIFDHLQTELDRRKGL